MGKVKNEFLDVHTLTAECKTCKGEGCLVGDPTDFIMVECTTCEGEGEIHCANGGVDCHFEFCYCEAAWDRQQEDLSRGD